MAGVFDIELDGGEPHRFDGGALQEEMEDDQMYSNVADVSFINAVNVFTTSGDVWAFNLLILRMQNGTAETLSCRAWVT